MSRSARSSKGVCSYYLPQSSTKPDGATHIHIDLAQRGVGGNNSWGQPPEPAYRLDASSYALEFWMKPLGPGDEPAAVRRRSLPEVTLPAAR